MQCPKCGSHNTRFSHKRPDGSSVYVCRSCGHDFVVWE